MFERRRNHRRGQASVEGVLLVVLIAATILLSLTKFSQSLSRVWRGAVRGLDGNVAGRTTPLPPTDPPPGPPPVEDDRSGKIAALQVELADLRKQRSETIQEKNRLSFEIGQMIHGGPSVGGGSEASDTEDQAQKLRRLTFLHRDAEVQIEYFDAEIARKEEELRRLNAGGR